MITDEELKGMRAALRWPGCEATTECYPCQYPELYGDGCKAWEREKLITDAMPRLIAEVERLRGDLLESHTQISLLTAEVGRLRKLDKTW